MLFNPDTGETRAMRTKEDAADYRYFPDPDLPPLCISEQWIQQVRGLMAELPRVMAERFVRDYGLPEYDAAQLTQSKTIAGYFEETAKACGQAKLASNWIMGEVSRRLNAEAIDIAASPVSAACLAMMIKAIADKEISNNAGKVVLDALWENRRAVVSSSPDELSEAAAIVHRVIEVKGLKQMNDTGALEKLVDEVIAANAKNVAEFRAGNEKALNALVGQIMKGSKGTANPQQVNELLRRKLG